MPFHIVDYDAKAGSRQQGEHRPVILTGEKDKVVYQRRSGSRGHRGEGGDAGREMNRDASACQFHDPPAGAKDAGVAARDNGCLLACPGNLPGFHEAVE